MKKFHYVYLTINLINGKQYIGDHSTDNINDNYIGSGRLFKMAVKKYGKENFNKQILEYFENKQLAFNAQKSYIEKFNTMIPNGYNVSPTGGHGTNGGYLSEESRKKISQNLSKAIKGKPHNENWNKKVSEALKGRKFSPTHKQALSEKHKGKSSWIKGKTHSEETREKISKAGKGRKHSPETIEKFKKRIPWNKDVKLK